MPLPPSPLYFLCAGVPQYIQLLDDLFVACHKPVVLFTCLAETNNLCMQNPVKGKGTRETREFSQLPITQLRDFSNPKLQHDEVSTN